MQLAKWVLLRRLSSAVGEQRHLKFPGTRRLRFQEEATVLVWTGLGSWKAFKILVYLIECIPFQQD